MKVKLISDGEFLGTADHINPDTGVIIYMDRYFIFNPFSCIFEQASAQRIHAIEYAPRKTPEDEPELPFTQGLTIACQACTWSISHVDPTYTQAEYRAHMNTEHGVTTL